MSVIVIVKFPGARVDKFREVYDRHTEMMKGISAEGRSKGAIHHQFVEDENGDAMVIDEWGSLEEFEAFFGAQEDIKKVVSEFGLTGEPRHFCCFCGSVRGRCAGCGAAPPRSRAPSASLREGASRPPGPASLCGPFRAGTCGQAGACPAGCAAPPNLSGRVTCR
jgi:hypothetical protein